VSSSIHRPTSSDNIGTFNDIVYVRHRGQFEVFAFSKVAATEGKQPFLHSFPFLTIEYPRVLLFWVMYWPLGIWRSNSLLRFQIGTPKIPISLRNPLRWYDQFFDDLSSQAECGRV
jgi:hypothetical protein